MNLRPSISLEVKKRVGSNTIDIVDGLRHVIADARALIPENVAVTVTNDAAQKIRENLVDLQNNVISAILLVVVCVMLMLGIRTGLLVGFSIPLSFLLGILFLSFLGIGINMVVLFGLILAVGMLVDGAIVITEYADKKMTEGMPRDKAYAESSSRMLLPVLSSTATTLMAFAPMVFWPGIMGEFLRYLPITVICILTASLIVALVFVPILGALIGKAGAVNEEEEKEILATEHGDFSTLKGYMKIYHDTLDFALRRPVKMFLGTIAILVVSFVLYGMFGVGVELFPSSEPDFVNINVHARGNLSIDEKAELVGDVEDAVSELPYFKNVYSRSGAKSRSATEDVIGYIQVELKDWQYRPNANRIMKEMDDRLKSMPGVIIEIGEEKKGPVSGKPIELEISARADDQKLIDAGYRYIQDAMNEIGGFRNIDNTLPLPGIQWEFVINKAQAAKFGVGVSAIGNIVQMMTRGYKISSYMPADLDEEIDILVRFPERFRALDMIGNLYVVTTAGASVPLSTFVKVVPGHKVNMIQRIDGRRIIRVSADVVQGTFAAQKIASLKAYTQKNPPPQDVRIKFRGEEEDSQENMAFLQRALFVAVMMMFLTMLLQFNSFYSTAVIMFSIVLSTIGVVLGLVITHDPFSITMTGLAIISLAGIVINNNIILIDAYDEIKHKVADPIDALKRTGLQRLRPVYLTTITTMLGLLPMSLKLNMDFVNADITIGAPSMGMWAAFSRSMIFGMLFSTVLTLVLTPCMVLMGIRMKEWMKDRWRLRKSRRAQVQAAPE
jgi:multidrug efflux pump